MAVLQTHRPFVIILLIHLLLAAAYASLVPLGEAPDEPAHLSYARFIARQGRLPATLPERKEAGYRSTWPPLYHSLVAIPLALVGETAPARLKAVGDTPRRLIPTNGQTIAAFIHTVEEGWPWRGLPLAWHTARFISVLLMALAVTTTYLLAWRLTGQRWLAAGAAALHAFLPQVLFIGGVVSDDNLLILLSGLLLLLMVGYSQQPSFPTFWRFFLLGIVLGLATVAKYNALPLWLLVSGWLIWLAGRQRKLDSAGIKRIGYAGLALLLGAGLAAGGWFFFIWRNFNQVADEGWLKGSLAALSAGTADASLRQLSSGQAQLILPSVGAWREWITTFFSSFWGLFGGGGTIAWPDWIYGLLALFSLLALAGLFLRRTNPEKSRQSPLLRWLFLVPLLFLALPLLRFSLSGGNIGETAQGRHLFPALPAIALLLATGLTQFVRFITENPKIRLPFFSFISHSSRFTFYILTLILLSLSLYSLWLIQASYPPAIPLYTSTGRLGGYHPVQAPLAPEIKLIGYELGPVKEMVLPVTLLWQAEAIPAEDYLIQLRLIDPAGQLWGEWLGHPLGGRYPSRAWDEGDILRDTIPLPLLSSSIPVTAHLTVALLDTAQQAVTAPVTLALTHPLKQDQAPLASQTLLPPTSLRADDLAETRPFSYRSTLSLVGPAQGTPPKLLAPDGRSFSPDRFIKGPERSLAHFIVGSHWPAGNYRLVTLDKQIEVQIFNRVRQFEVPPMAYRLEANFGDQITVLGYDLPQDVVTPGESFPLTLHMRAERALGQNLVLFNHLLDAEAVQWGGADRIPKSLYTTLLWVPGEIVSDAYQVPVDPDAPPGIYWLDIGFYPDQKAHFSLPLFVEGQPVDQNSARIGPIKVGGPPPGLTTSTPEPQSPRHDIFGEQITLLGFDLEAKERIKLYWQANKEIQADYTVFIHLLDPAGQVVAQADGPPAGGAYPTRFWEPGEIIKDERVLPELPPGHYILRLGLYQADSGQRLTVPGTPDNAVTLLEFEAQQPP